MIYLEKQAIDGKYIYKRVRLFIDQTMCLENNVIRRKNASYSIHNTYGS